MAGGVVISCVVLGPTIAVVGPSDYQLVCSAQKQHHYGP